MTRRQLKSLFLTTLLAGLLAGCSDAKAPSAQPPATVHVVPGAREKLALFIEAVASIDGFVNADIRARVKGVGQTGRSWSPPRAVLPPQQTIGRDERRFRVGTFREREPAR